jgi:DNA-binding IscR family transcriptional regulator
MLIKLLRTDTAALLAQRDFRDKVIAVLREAGLLPSKPGPGKGDLRLVKPPNPSD